MMSLLLRLVMAGPALTAEPARPAQTEIQGTIVKVAVSADRQGPRLVVQSGKAGEEWTIWLGSFRYLMTQDFNPKAGQQVTIRGFARAGRELVAVSVMMRDTGRTLRLRDDEGYPLWRGQGKKKP